MTWYVSNIAKNRHLRQIQNAAANSRHQYILINEIMMFTQSNTDT